MLMAPRREEKIRRSGLGSGVLGVVARHAELVAVRVSEICAVVVGVVLRPQARWPFAMPAVCQGRSVHCIHLRAGAGDTGVHPCCIEQLLRELARERP